VNKTLQDGDPGEIAELARAFYLAGVCTSETSDAFNNAQKRFQESWDRETGDHPINDSAEVQRAQTQLHVQRDELDNIGVELMEISASLAAAQTASEPSILQLNNALTTIDGQIGNALTNNADQATIDRLVENARTVTRNTLATVTGVRDDYTNVLSGATTRMQGIEGYNPDILEGVAGDGKKTQWEQSQEAAEQYGQTQRAADQALVDAGGPMTPEKQAALNRLQDYATVTDAQADPTARFYAGERLDDYQTSRLQGPYPPDPILGMTPLQRAQQRLALQQQLERGWPELGIAGVSRDQATSLLDMAEDQSKTLTVQKAVELLQQQGMSQGGAIATVDGLSKGMTWEELGQYGNNILGHPGKGIEWATKLEDMGRHNLVVQNADDIAALGRIGKNMGFAGDVLQTALTLDAIYNDGAPAGLELTKLGGNLGGGTALAAIGAVGGGIVLGPPGALLFGAIGSYYGGKYGEQGAEAMYNWATK
jgi:Skp family chaperone for outer membrane proteins